MWSLPGSRAWRDLFCSRGTRWRGAFATATRLSVHQEVWPTIENTLSTKNYTVILFDVS
jgi:hypothetical protein